MKEIMTYRTSNQPSTGPAGRCNNVSVPGTLPLVRGVLAGLALSLSLGLSSCTTGRVPVDEVPDHIGSNPEGKGVKLEILMQRGPEHNHPLMAVWAEDMDGRFLQTLYVSESIGRGVFQHGDKSEGFWQAGEIKRPAALPRWWHRRNIGNPEGGFLPSPRYPVADAYTGPTPPRSFVLHTRLDDPAVKEFMLYFEINQTWDFNEHWTNNKFPDDAEYKTSCQPALVYAARVVVTGEQQSIPLDLVGRSHESGTTGELYDDLETMSTALEIVDRLVVTLPGDDL